MIQNRRDHIRSIDILSQSIMSYSRERIGNLPARDPMRPSLGLAASMAVYFLTVWMLTITFTVVHVGEANHLDR